ncbi:acetylcholinesterase [Dichotomopilus funicola]|uniref:Carboxylic ester hydrolase n=1 Tax=Dichotomopilus funicola TaxID=1934379 RepID=A0AAN6ZMB0_9PEZI|nr:acetylcholinesterase [Dichotomopilus funicola]
MARIGVYLVTPGYIDGLTVKTTTGTYTGLVNDTTPDVGQWLGIQYGVAPVGERRFLPAEKAPDLGETDAKDYKPICIQQSGNKTDVFWGLIKEFQNADEQSEDCLYLNVWAPKKPKKEKLPVIVWVCGGGFREGGGHAPYQVPDQWIQRTQTHLVVTFNYRLNVFGFPGSPAADQNAGFTDIRLVNEWVRDNIAGFGGDPDRVVLYGQSAGGNAVASYGYAYPEDPIVTGLIASSGSVGATNSANNSAFHDLAQVVGCANLTSTEELACMQKVDALELQKYVEGIKTQAFKGSFRPIADGVTAFPNNTERLEKGLIAKIPMITGYNFNEGAAFLPFDPDATAPPAGGGIPGGNGLGCGVVTEANARASHGLRTYQYLVAGNFSNITPRYWLGGMHSSEIPLVFGTHFEFRGNSTEFEWQTSYAMEAYWVSFAANSSAAPVDHLGQPWPEYSTADDGQVVVFGNATVPGGASYAELASVANQYSGC